MIVQDQKCPICGRSYTGYPALSRKDNKTMICPDCGITEAIQAFMMSKEEANNERWNQDK